MRTTVTSKRQITLPAEVQKRFGIRRGDVLMVIPDEASGRIILELPRRRKAPEDVLTGTAGMWRDAPPGHDFVRELREGSSRRLEAL